MDFDSLRCFVEVVRQQNVTRAAAILNLAQPAVTRRIHLLEEELGVTLLTRHRRGVQATEAGVIVSERAEFMLRFASELRDEVHARTGEPSGHVRFAFPPSIGNVMVARLVSDLLRRFPRVTFQLHEQFSPAVREALIAGGIDIGIMSCEAGHPDLLGVPMFQERLWLIGPAADWPFGRVSALSPRRLVGRPLLLASFLRLALDKLGVEARLRFNVRLEADALATLCEGVRMGAGFLVGPPSSVTHELERGEFVGAPVRGLRVTRGLYRRRDRPVTRALAELAAQIEADSHRLLVANPRMFRPVDG